MDKLLNLLKANARATVEDLAKELNLTAEEVRSRIAEYERDETILGYQAILNSDKTAAAIVTAVIEVKITPERGGGFDRLAARIAKFEEVKSCYLMSGSYDLLVVVEGANLQEIAKFVAEKLSTVKGVISTTSHFRLKTYKENDTLLDRQPRPQRLPVAP